MNFLKENWLSWIVAIIACFAIILNEQFSKLIELTLIRYLIIYIPLISIILLIIYGEILYGIEENLWDEFKKGKDFHIDRMMNNLKRTIILILFFNLIYIAVHLYASFYLIKKNNFYNCFLLLLFPLAIVLYLSIHYLKLKREYEK